MKTVNAVRRVSFILAHEWKATFRNANAYLFVSLLPLLLTGQGLALTLAAGAGQSNLPGGTSMAMLTRALANLRPELANLPESLQYGVLFYLQMPLFFMLIPMMIANSLATFSVVEEKQSGTLESLLSLPVKTSEILLGKGLAYIVPSVGITWVCAAVFHIVIMAVSPQVLQNAAALREWMLFLLVMCPLSAFIAFTLGVMGSSRARDAKSAQMTSLFVVLPVVALMALGFTGLMNLNLTGLGIVCAVLALIAFVLFRISVRVFRREKILSDWK